MALLQPQTGAIPLPNPTMVSAVLGWLQTRRVALPALQRVC